MCSRKFRTKIEKRGRLSRVGRGDLWSTGFCMYSLYILHFYWTRVFFFRIISLPTFYLLFLVTFKLNNGKHRIVEIIYDIGSHPSPPHLQPWLSFPSLLIFPLSVTVKGHTKTLYGGGGGGEIGTKSYESKKRHFIPPPSSPLFMVHGLFPHLTKSQI